MEKQLCKTKKKVSLENFLVNLLFITVLFPYVTFGLPAYSDSQPWAVLVGSLLLIFNVVKNRNVRFHKITLMVISLSLICILNVTVFFIFQGGELTSYLRTIFKYINFMIIIPIVIIYFGRFSLNILSFSILLWFMLVIAQIITKRVLVDLILSRNILVYGRNFAMGFAPEPAYMAKVCIFFLLMIDYYKNLRSIKPVKAMILTLFALVMILASASLTGFVLVIIYFLIKLFLPARKSNFGKVQKIILICFLIVTLILFLPLLVNFVTKHDVSNFGKVGYYISEMLENGSLFIFLADQSFKGRLGGFIRNFSSFVSGSVFGLGVPIYPTGSIFSPVYDSGVFGFLFSVLSLFILPIFRTKRKKLRNYLIELFVMFIFFNIF